MNHSINNNPVTASALALAPPPLHPPQPHRPSTSCDRHPEERFTGFCPSCLFERLSVLDIPSSSRKPPSSSSVSTLKSIFKPSSSSAGSSSLFSELRRTKSFSATKNSNDCVSAFEPQRRSCDVRVRNTLWSLFNEEVSNSEIVKSPVFEEEIEIESEKDINCGIPEEPRSSIDEIVEEIEERNDFEEVKKTEEVKEEKQMETTTKKPNRSFWSAASVLSKKLQKWRQKQKLKKHHRRGGIGDGSSALPVEKSIGRQLRDTQSEIAEYRRSCDTDPRFSIDAGRFSLDAGRVSFDAARVSVDDPRYSFDEPRASWDGYLMGRTVAPPRMPSMLSVVEDSPVRNQNLRSDGHIPVEEPPQTPPPRVVMDEIVPGGSEQTREYYTDSSSRRRKSLDRSSSTRKISASVIAEIDELKRSGSKIKVSPSQVAKDSVSHSHSNSLRDDCSDIGVRGEDAGTVESSKKGSKKSKRWSWNIFGLLHRKNGNKYEEEEDRSGVDRTFSGSWNVDTRKGFDPKMMRSNSSVSWRSPNTGGGGLHRNSVDGYVSGKKKVSSSGSTNGRKIENGMLKFYLTPGKGRRRGSSNSTEQKTTRGPVPSSHPLGRNVMNFY